MLRNDLGYQAPYVGKSDEEWRELHPSYDDESYDEDFAYESERDMRDEREYSQEDK